jgi:hypothetical protein
VYEGEHAQTTEGVYKLRVSERAKVKVNMAGIGLRGPIVWEQGPKSMATGYEHEPRAQGDVAGRIVVFVVLLSSPPCSSLSSCPASASAVIQAEEKCRRKTNAHVTPV